MSLFIRRPAFARPFICPRCSQPWLQRRAFIASPQSRDAAHQGAKTADGLNHQDSLKDNGKERGIGHNSHPTSNSSSGLKGLKKRTKPNESSAKQRTILGQSADLPIRARFAPSPTGYLHLGSLRTALFNSLAATASNDGAFILRIEDTDQSRLVEDAEERLLEDLEWAGLSWHEGPDCGGPYGPYRQSERLDIYKDHIHKLIDDGHAYRCFCSPEQLESQKRKLHEAGQPTLYPGTCRSVPRNESDRRASEGESHVVRFNAGPFGQPKLRDAIYGPFQKKDSEEDFILLKTDGFPTYHFANVVDDHLMKITHVIRGEEWLISTPKHIALYQAFGWELPTFAHLGLLVDLDGSKLSKRNASVNMSKYRDGGIFPMALLAWLANLGSSFTAKAKPPRTVDDVADALTFKFTRGGIKLNPEKLEYFQAKYRDALLWNPVEGLAAKESELIDHYLIQPMLHDINATTNGTNPVPSQTWQHPLNPIPVITSSDETRANYIHRVFASKPGDFPSSETLIHQHPYLFWRVPLSLYRASLASFTPDQRILSALDNAISNEALWADGEGTKVTPAIREELDVDVATLHNALRLVGAGSEHVVSMNSARMFALLGREEWRHRLDVVKRLLGELGHGPPS